MHLAAWCYAGPLVNPLAGVPLPEGLRTAREAMAQTPDPTWRCQRCGAETDLAMRLILSPEDYATIQDGDWYRNGTAVFHAHEGTGYRANPVTAPVGKE